MLAGHPQTAIGIVAALRREKFRKNGGKSTTPWQSTAQPEKAATSKTVKFVQIDKAASIIPLDWRTLALPHSPTKLGRTTF